jgi:glycosyltransferase involved in cell wall biosynthesis
MIVKNEEHVIRRCLRSVKPFIDSYSISDTGSTDSTMDIILEELAGLPGVLESDPWQDFSTNRNLSLKRAVGDHVLLIDADEILVHTGGPMMLDDYHDGYNMRFATPNMTYYKTKIIRNDPRWHYEGRTHEGIYFVGEPNQGEIPNFYIDDREDSTSRVSGEKYERDLKVFETEPATPRNVFYHALTLMMLGRGEEAIKKFYERVAMGAWEEEAYYSLWKIAEIMIPNYPLYEVAGAFYRAYIYRPSRLEALVKLCEILRGHKMYDEVYRLSLVEVKPTSDILFVDHHVPWLVLIEHANAAHHLGKFAESQEYYRRVGEIVSQWTSSRNFIRLSQIYYQIERWQECKNAALKALQLQPDFPEALNNICCACNQLGQFAEGKAAAEEALRLRPNFQLAKGNLEWSIRELNKRKNKVDTPAVGNIVFRKTNPVNT